MGEISATIGGATLPYSVVVRKIGETSGNRCTGACNNFPITFTHDSGSNSYYFIVTDANGCVIDSRNQSGGVSNINCDVLQPNFTAVVQQPTCTVLDEYVSAVLHLTDITNAHSYKICYNTTTMDCASCTTRDGTIPGSNIDITLITPDHPATTTFTIRVYKDATCVSYKDFFGSFTTPICNSLEIPSYTTKFYQAYCSSGTGGTLQNASLNLTNIQNATRYKTCYNSTNFSSCDSTCAISDGIITGNSVTIPIIPPSQGVTQPVLVRIFNGNSCDVYNDILLNVSSPNCNGQHTLIILDTQINVGAGYNCTTNLTKVNDYDIYITPNTVGVTENGQKALSKGGSDRMIPNGATIPNVIAVASPELSCGPNPFYRFQINLTYLRSKYPSITDFTFDIYANRTITTGTSSTYFDIIPKINRFAGVRMIDKPVHTGCDGVTPAPAENTDAGRDPCGSSYPGNPFPTTGNLSTIVYNNSISGYRKIAILTYSFSTNLTTWTPV